MSKLKERVCSARALLVLGALLAPVAASAFTVSPFTDQYPFYVGWTTFTSNSTVAPLGYNLNVNLTGSDLILGRTTGFSIRISLGSGAQFATNPTFNSNPRTALQTCTPGCVQGGWSVTLAAGGAGYSYVVYSIQPTAAGATIGTGLALSLRETGELSNLVAALGQPGGVLTGTTALVDPNTAQTIEAPVTANLLASVDPISFNVNPFGVSPFPGTVGNYIDVGSNSQIASKTWFGDSTIGSLLAGTYGAGIVSSGIAQSNALYDGSSIYYGYLVDTTNDLYSLQLGGNFSAFTQPGAMVYLDPSGTCGTVPAAGSPLLATVTPTSAAFAGFTADDVNPSASGYPQSGVPETTIWQAAVCFSVPNGNSIVIPPSQYTAQLSFTGAGVSTGYNFPNQIFPYAAAGASTTEPTQPLLTMNYNGPVVTVATVNPAGNTTEQSFLRVNNAGSLGGLVTITGVDDAGHVASGQVSFILPANHSIDLNSTVLQSGSSSPINGIMVNGALGTPVGKWVLTVTGQFQGMVVTSLNRNNSTGTVSDLTRAEKGRVLPLGTGPAGQ